MDVKVATLEAELKFKISPKKNGREFFDVVSRNLGVHETWFFGVNYKDADNEDVWIDQSKKSLSNFKNHLHKLRYRVKFYPEDVEVELLEEVTVLNFFLQVKGDVLRDEIYCPPETCVLLASYALQAKYGDYSEELVTANGSFSVQKLLPERVYKQHKLKEGAWEESIKSLWKKHTGIVKDDAMLEYLKLAQNLEMYGVTYFDIKNKKGTPLLLGVTCLGLNIYKPEDKLNPSIAFPWSEIHNINYKDKKFTIKSTDKGSAGFIFFVSEAKTNKRILSLGIGNHSLYVRRRKPDTLEVVQMKIKSTDVKKQRLEQTKRLQKEIAARQLAEKREKQYQEEIAALKEEMARNQKNLLEAQKTIQELKDQLDALQKAKENLEVQQKALQDMMKRLEESKTMETAEKSKLEQEIYVKQEEVQRIQEEIQRKDEETLRLQQLVEEAERREAELRQQQLEELERRQREEELRRLEEEERRAREEELQKLEPPLPPPSPPPQREEFPEVVEVSKDIKDQLKELQEQLEQSRDESQETPMDKIHRENVKEGRNKYKTLQEIRKGNTVRRVDLFENL